MKKEHMMTFQGKEFVTYAGLLDEAHQQGLCRVRTQVVQLPTADNGNVAVVHAEVETSKGTFSGIGDASPGNVNRMIAPHIIRMAETRAKARALRDAINVGETAIEELGGDAAQEDADANVRPLQRANHAPASPAKATPSQKNSLQSVYTDLAEIQNQGQAWNIVLKAAAKLNGITLPAKFGELSAPDAQALLAWGQSQVDMLRNSAHPVVETPAEPEMVAAGEYAV